MKPNLKVPTLAEQNEEIRQECQRLADFLCAKNTAYGGQALAPIAIASKGDPLDIIFARIDDKLSRIIRGEAAGEDPWCDLRGYITLWQVVLAFKKKGFYTVEEPIANNSNLPMPINMRYLDEDNFPLQDGGTAENPTTLIHESDDPTDLSVGDLDAIASQVVTSLQPNVPEVFEEKNKSDAGQVVSHEEDPWKALQRPLRRRGSPPAPLSPGTNV
jgi:hypothetical protein